LPSGRPQKQKLLKLKMMVGATTDAAILEETTLSVERIAPFQKQQLEEESHVATPTSVNMEDPLPKVNGVTPVGITSPIGELAMNIAKTIRAIMDVNMDTKGADGLIIVAPLGIVATPTSADATKTSHEQWRQVLDNFKLPLFNGQFLRCGGEPFPHCKSIKIKIYRGEG